MSCSTDCRRVGLFSGQSPRSKSGDSLILLFNDAGWIVECSGVEDNDLRGCLALIDAIVEGVDDFDDGVAGGEVKGRPGGDFDGQLSAEQDAGINHGMTVGVESCAWRNADAQDGDVGLLRRVGGQHGAVPAVC